MAAYVLDTSVVVQRLIQDTHTPYVRALFQRLTETDDRLWVPEFCLVECANVLWKAVRFRGMPPEQAVQLLTDLATLPLRVVPVSDLLPRALTLGMTHNLSIYDSMYIAMVERLACPLVTVDARQSQAAAASGLMLKPVTDF
ncbi:MAG: type II toxin-antitoxin system VapC family toxin [Anaerolineae bacterium]|nr:type II toxin-antitoxin system VapC family toxin [Anaerolineae bacterium]